VLLSHGWAVPVLHRNSPGAEVGITLILIPIDLVSPSDANFQLGRKLDGQFNRWYLDPLYGRHYPADQVADYIAAGHLPVGGPTFIQTGDLDAIAAQTDFLGVNYYTTLVLRDEVVPVGGDQLPVSQAPEVECTEMVFPVNPEGLYRLLNRLHFNYQPRKLYITENGASYSHSPDKDVRIRDQRRLNYLQEHFTAAHRAIECVVPLAGYLVWSLMDNFEWNKGYAQCYGLAWTDYETQQRIPKDSAMWYKQVIAENALVTPI
jgi:beta-glucosidase